MPTANFNINAEDGWVAVASGGVDFIRIRSNTPNHAFYVTEGATLPATSEVPASGTITVAGLPVADETVTIGSQVFVFKASAAGALEVTIGGTAAITAANLLAKINSNSTVVTATAQSATIIRIQAVARGAAGNAVVLTEAATNITVSGSGTLAGGVTPTIGYKQQCDEGFWCDVPITDNVYVRIIENLPQETRIDVFYIT